MATVKHHHQTVVADDPTKDVSANVWNADHDVTLVDGDIPATIARDAEVTSAVAAEATARDTAIGVAVAAEATLARNADNLASGTVADARIAATIARDSEVTAAVGAEATARDAAIETHRADTTNVHGITDTANLSAVGHSHAGEDITSGTVADGRVASTLARDSETTAAVAAEATARDAAIATHAGLSDPHPGYLTPAEGAAAYDATGAAAAAQAAAIAASQPLDADLTAIGGLIPTNDDIIQRKAGGWTNRTIAQLVSDLALGSVYQPLDSDLTSIAALSTTSYGRSLLEAANAAGLRTLAGSVIGTDVEAHDPDLTTFAGLSPTNDDILQRKSGAWANRTIAQLLTDLAAAGTTFQPLDADLTSIAALTTTSFGRSLLALADAAALAAAHTHAASSASYLGYPTIGGSTQAMTIGRCYCAQITAGASGNELLGIQAYLDQTVEATLQFAFSLYADSGSDTIGDLLFMSHPSIATVFAHGTGGGVSFPARWFGTGVGYPLAASTKYWIGVSATGGTGAPRLYKDGSGSDRYYVVGTGSYHNDGAYNAGTQTNTSNKHSIRARVL